MELRKTLKKLLFKYNYIGWRVSQIRRKQKCFFCKNHIDIINHGGVYKIIKEINGSNNCVIIDAGCYLDNVVIHMIGNNNTIRFGKNVHIGPGCSFWTEGNNCKISIGENTTFTQMVHFNAQEDNSEIICGKDCMFSNTIIVRTSDSHAIIDTETHKRINPAKNVIIGDHVWIAPSTTIMKGANIGANTIIGSHTLVTKNIPSNVLAVGMPAKIVKEDITWSREDIIFKKKDLYNE